MFSAARMSTTRCPAGLFGAPERESCLNQGGVGQGLWVVAEVLPGGRVDLFGVQAKGAGHGQ